MSNIRRANVCAGSGTSASSSQDRSKGSCWTCNRQDIRVRRDGTLYVHSSTYRKRS